MKVFPFLLSREEVDAVAKRLKLKLFRTSVKENFNVDKGIILVQCLTLLTCAVALVQCLNTWHPSILTKGQRK